MPLHLLDPNKVKNKIDDFFFKSKNEFLNSQNIILLICLFCIINIIIIAPDLFEIFGNNGIIGANINDRFLSPYQLRLSWLINYLENFGIPERYTISGIVFIYITSLFLIIKKKNSVSLAVIAYLIKLILLNSSYMFSYGADSFILFLLFLNIFLNLSLAIRKDYGDVLFSFLIRFLQIQMCIIYFFAGFGKILGHDWIDGNAVWMILHSYMPSSINTIHALSSYPIIFKLLSWTVLIELLYPFLIFIPIFRKPLLVIVIAIHIGIAIFMQFYTFGFVMILLNIIAFGKSFQFIRNQDLIFNRYEKKLKFNT